MGPAAAAALIYQRFIDAWAAQTPFRLDNEQFEPPAYAPWVDLTIQPVVDRQQTLGQAGNRKFFRRDMLRVTIATPKDQGTLTAWNLAATIQTIFEGYRTGGLYVTHAERRRIGNDGRWFRVVVDVLFNYHEQK